MRTLIADGTVVSATGRVRADVVVSGEVIEAVVAPGSEIAASLRRGGDVRLIDATDRYVVPGGVDVHTHMELPFGGTYASDTFETGTRAAAHGGTTTILDFAVQREGEDVRECLDAWFAKAEGQCAIDYGFHMILGGIDERSLKEMDTLVNEGITSFKLFMAYPGVLYSDDGKILRAMQQAHHNGGLIMMHAENGIAIDVIAGQAAARGQTDPVYHGITRPPRLEGEATYRAIQLALVAGTPVYFVHLSASDALAHVAAARNEGYNVFAETCPQYLYLNLEEHLGAPGFAGAGYVCSPPLRSRHETHHADLWRGLRTNDLCVVSTDHCPFCMEGAEGAGARRLPPDPQRARRGGAPHGPHLPGCGAGRAVAGALGRDVRHHPGAHVRALPPQGQHHAGGRRRRGRLQPQRGDPHQRRGPPHEPGLLVLRGLRDRRRGGDGAVAGPGGGRWRQLPGQPGRRPVPAAQPVAVPPVIEL